MHVCMYICVSIHMDMCVYVYVVVMALFKLLCGSLFMMFPFWEQQFKPTALYTLVCVDMHIHIRTYPHLDTNLLPVWESGLAAKAV